MSNGQLLLLRLVLCAAVSAAMTWIGWKLGGKPWALLGFLFSAPIMGAALRKPLVEGIHEGFTWLSQRPLAKWQGSYHAFNEVQVRVYEDGDQLWFAAKDVLDAVGMRGIPDSFLAIYPEGSRVIPGTRLTGLNAAAVERMLGNRNEHEAIRFLQWMRREVVRPWERKKERA
ncbi:MAG TPA: hypothetical protein VFK48_11950 [Usitatibacter sp.]|nr:hypothetical protein [Usitatibacter sp.]